MTAVIFVCCASALLVDFLNKYKSFEFGLDICDIENSNYLYCLEFWALISMWSVVCVFLFLNMVCCTVIRKEAGAIISSS